MSFLATFWTKIEISPKIHAGFFFYNLYMFFAPKGRSVSGIKKFHDLVFLLSQVKHKEMSFLATFWTKIKISPKINAEIFLYNIYMFFGPKESSVSSMKNFHDLVFLLSQVKYKEMSFLPAICQGWTKIEIPPKINAGIF